MKSELIEQLQKIAALNGTDLFDAQNDPLFGVVKSNFEAEEKRRAASLPASNGGRMARKPKKTFQSPGLDRNEHMKMFKQAQG